MDDNKGYEMFIIAIRVLVSIPEFVKLMQTTDLFDYEDKEIHTFLSEEEKINKGFVGNTLSYNILSLVQLICDKITSVSNLTNIDIQKEITKNFKDPKQQTIHSKKDIRSLLSLLSLEIIERIMQSIKFMYKSNTNFVQHINALFGESIYTMKIDDKDVKSKTILEEYLSKEITNTSEYIIVKVRCGTHGTQTEDLSFIKTNVLVTQEKIKYQLFGVIVIQTTNELWYFLKYNDKDKVYLKYTYNSPSHEELSSLNSLFERNWMYLKTKTIQITALIFKKTK